MQRSSTTSFEARSLVETQDFISACVFFFFPVVLFLSSITEIEARLPSPQLMALCRNEAVLKWMSTCDHLMYQALVEILIPDVLRPIPSKERPRALHLYTFPTLMPVLLRAGPSVLAVWTPPTTAGSA